MEYFCPARETRLRDSDEYRPYLGAHGDLGEVPDRRHGVSRNAFHRLHASTCCDTGPAADPENLLKPRSSWPSHSAPPAR